MSDTSDQTDNVPVDGTASGSGTGDEGTVDRLDRRFRIEGDAVEALKVVVAGRSSHDS